MPIYLAMTGPISDFSTGRRRNNSRSGFSNVTLIIALAVFALVSLLTGIQAGDINISAFMPAGKAARKSKSSQSSPLLLAEKAEAQADETVDSEPVDSALDAVQTETESVPEGASRIDGRTRQLVCKAVGLMDPALAARRIEKLSDNDATLVLSCLKRRDLAYILEMADPVKTANWINILLQVDGNVDGIAAGESVLEQLGDEPVAADFLLDDNAIADSAGLEGILEQLGAAPDATEGIATGNSDATQVQARSSADELPDFMLTAQEREEFLTQFPQYRTDNRQDGRTGSIPVISDFEVTQ